MRVFLSSFLVLSACWASAANLLTNGDFSAGRTGFTTDYNYVAPATDALFPADTYTLVTNTLSPYNLDTRGAPMANLSDHTTGTGLFMAINGGTVFNSLVWKETISGLTVGQSYRFTGWISRWTTDPNTASAKLQVTAGGFLVTAFQDPGVSAVWEKQTGLFTATSSSLSLEIRDLETADGGNDFGLDDLSVEAVPEPSSLCFLGFGAFGFAAMRRKRS